MWPLKKKVKPVKKLRLRMHSCYMIATYPDASSFMECQPLIGAIRTANYYKDKKPEFTGVIRCL